MNEKKFDLEDRLIEFAVAILKFVENLPVSKSALHLGGQQLRSGTSPSLNYGEAKSGESKNDFIHKMKVCLKELRESYNCLRILQRAKTVSYTHLRAHETVLDIVCRLLLEKKKK